MTSKKLGGLLMKLLLFIKAFISQKNNLYLPLPQRFEETFAHESKYQKISLDTSADN